MEEIIRVISDGQEIERILGTVLLNEGIPCIRYRERFWAVVDGCIQLNEPINEDDSSLSWAALIQHLLPQVLPDQTDSCAKLLQDCFRGNLPHGITQAIASLAALRLEQQARIVIVEFFKAHHNASRLHRLFQMQLLFRDRSERIKDSVDTLTFTATDHLAEATSLSRPEDNWDWSPSPDETEIPDVDDSSLRANASKLQESIGLYQKIESDKSIPGFEDLHDEKDNVINPPNNALVNESALLERTSKLDKIGLDLLRYFSDNPGDRAAHAEAVLGYPATEIRRLLLGALRQYLKKTGSGGWECQPWVEHVLSALDRNFAK